MFKFCEINKINRDAAFIEYREKKLFRLFKAVIVAECILLVIRFALNILQNVDFSWHPYILVFFTICILLVYIIAMQNSRSNLRMFFIISVYLFTIASAFQYALYETHDIVGLLIVFIAWPIIAPFSYRKIIIHGLIFILIFNLSMVAVLWRPFNFFPLLAMNAINFLIIFITSIFAIRRNRSDMNDYVNTNIINKQIDDLKTGNEQLKDEVLKRQQSEKKLEELISHQTEELDRTTTQLLELQNKNLQTQFEILKSQVNPHFLFNSLNVLSSLIKFEPDLAEEFTEQLAKVYRYILENKDKDLIPVRTEIEFLNAYVFLLNIRFQDKLKVDISVEDEVLDMYLVPLALQLLLENCIKHNTFSKKSPLNIKVYSDRCCYITISNNIQKRESHFASTGVGLKNIESRYALISDNKPEFIETEFEFTARIPLIETV